MAGIKGFLGLNRIGGEILVHPLIPAIPVQTLASIRTRITSTIPLQRFEKKINRVDFNTKSVIK